MRISAASINELLDDAIHNQDLCGVRRIIDSVEGGIDYGNDDGKTALRLSIDYRCSTDFIAALLDLGADPDHQDNNYLSPLDRAYAIGNDDLIRLLAQYSVGDALPDESSDDLGSSSLG